MSQEWLVCWLTGKPRGKKSNSSLHLTWTSLTDAWRMWQYQNAPAGRRFPRVAILFYSITALRLLGIFSNVLIGQERLTSQLPCLSGFMCWTSISYWYQPCRRCSWKEGNVFMVSFSNSVSFCIIALFPFGSSISQWNNIPHQMEQEATYTSFWYCNKIPEIVEFKRGKAWLLFSGSFPLVVGAFGCIVREDIMVEACEQTGHPLVARKPKNRGGGGAITLDNHASQ